MRVLQTLSKLDKTVLAVHKAMQRFSAHIARMEVGAATTPMPSIALTSCSPSLTGAVSGCAAWAQLTCCLLQRLSADQTAPQAEPKSLLLMLLS